MSGQLRFSSYVGAKIDHPDGLPRWFIGNGGIENLRFVWPVFWGLAHNASRELIQELVGSPLLNQTPSLKDKEFDAREFQLSMEVVAGEEKRLSPSLRWHTLEEWKAIYPLDL